MKILAAGAFVIALVASSAYAADWKVGDKVEVYNAGWYDATVIGIGSGSLAGYYMVHYDGHPTASDQYLKADSVRARPGAAAVGTTQRASPRDGKYACLGYGGGPGKFRFYLNLAGGVYTQATPNLSAGRYTFDAGTGRVTFASGPYAANNWIGLFSVEREGKTHQIVLRDKANEAKGPRVAEFANIYCTLSSDSTY